MISNCYRFYRAFWMFIILSFSGVIAQPEDPPELPLEIPDHQIQPLRKWFDRDLQQALEKRIQRNKTWANLINKKRMAIGLVDLSDPYRPKFARINGNVMMYAASLPKLAILLASEQAVTEGRVPDSPDIRHDMRIMISQSDNAAATRMYDRIGGARYIERVLKHPQYQLYDARYGGGLWVGKRYAKTGKRYPDPIMGTTHGATAAQVCRFYYLLAMGKLVNRQCSKDMLDMMADPELHHKFVNPLNKLAPEAKIYRKSGTWRNWHSDSVLVWGPVWRRYILVGLVEDPQGEQILRDLLPAVEEVIQPNMLTY